MFSERLTKLRKEKDITQQEAADRLNMSRGTYAQYEIGRREPDFETLKKIARFFDCTTDYLLGLSDEVKHKTVSMVAEEQGKYNKNTEDLSRTQIAANMEGRYGEPPSPELVDLIREVIREEIKGDKK